MESTSAKYFVPQRILIEILLNTLKAADFALCQIKKFLADDSGVVVGNLDPLAFVFHPYLVTSYFGYFPLSHDISTDIALILQEVQNR